MPCKVSSVKRTPLFAFQLAKVNRPSLNVSHCEAVPTCGVNEANSARDTLVTAVVLSDVGCFGNGERRADDGESDTRLDISITRLEEVKKVVAAEILLPIAQLLVVTSSSIFLRAFADR